MNDEDKSRVNMAQLVRDMKENMPALIEFEQLQARKTRAKYLSLIEHGFNEAQAIQLCKS